MPEFCNDEDERARGALQWLHDAKKTARGRYVVYSAAFGVPEAIIQHGWPIREEHFISKKNQILMGGRKFKAVLTDALDRREWGA